MTNAHVFDGGFRDPPIDAAFAFRAAMTAMAHPGERQTITGTTAPDPLGEAAGTLIATLCDPETGIYLAGELDTEAVRGWITFHTGAPFVSAADADFALGTWNALMPVNQFKIGTPEYPDRSATLIIVSDAWAPENAVLRGPGIKSERRAWFPDPAAAAANSSLYPLGFDCFIACGAEITALPRSTKITEV